MEKHLKGNKKKQYRKDLMTEKEYLDDIRGWDDETIFDKVARIMSEDHLDNTKKIFE